MELLLSKRQMREELDEQRKLVGVEQRKSASNRITEKVLLTEAYRNAGTIMLYAATPEEVDTKMLIAAAIQAGKKVTLPRVDGNTLVAQVIGKENTLVKGPYGVLEPAMENEVVPAESIDLIIVPGLAFDEKGQRLGHGKGYYDRFLATTSATRIGIAHDFQVREQVPVDNHDEKMDRVITEGRSIQC